MPESVSVEEPFAPALMLAPPARLTFSAPLVTLSCVVGEVAVHVVDRDPADRERRVFVHRLRARHRVHRAVVHRAHRDRHAQEKHVQLSPRARSGSSNARWPMTAWMQTKTRETHQSAFLLSL